METSQKKTNKDKLLHCDQKNKVSEPPSTPDSSELPWRPPLDPLERYRVVYLQAKGTINLLFYLVHKL